MCHPGGGSDRCSNKRVLRASAYQYSLLQRTTNLNGRCARACLGMADDPTAQRTMASPLPASTPRRTSSPVETVFLSSHPDRIEVLMTQNDRSGAYTMYVLKCSTPNGRSWLVSRRYSEFAALQDQLLDQGHPAIAAIPFPPKRLLGSMDDETIQERHSGLQLWLNMILELFPAHRLTSMFLARSDSDPIEANMARAFGCCSDLRESLRESLMGGAVQPLTRLSFCWHPLSVPIETPTKGGGGCSRMTVSSGASVVGRRSEVVGAPGGRAAAATAGGGGGGRDTGGGGGGGSPRASAAAVRDPTTWTIPQKMALITSDYGMMCYLRVKWP